MYSWESELGYIFNGRKIMVTGASGFIGRHLCEALVKLGAEVYGLSRTATPQKLPAGCKSLKVDLRDYQVVKNTVCRIKPQIIYHLASLVTAKQDQNLVLPMLENNLVGTINLLLSAGESYSDRLVMVGSSEELANSSNPIPSSPYACAKACASLYSQMFYKVYNLPVAIARPFLTYGPGQELTKLIPYTIVSLLQGENPQVTSGKRLCDFVYVLDVVRGLLKAGIQPNIEGKKIDLGTGIATSLRDLVERLTQLTESQAQAQFGSLPERFGEHPQVANSETAQKLLNWQPLWSLSDGLVETVNWYKHTLNDSNGKA